MSVRAPKVAFVFHNARTALVAQVARGEAPDSTLLGANHLSALGYDARVHDPGLTRRRGGREPSRLSRHVNELILPWELRADAVVVTPLANLFPLAARARNRLRVVLVNYGLCTIYRRASPARRHLIGFMARSVDAVVALADWQRDLLREQTGMAADRGRTIRLGIDAQYFTPQSAPDGRDPFVVSIGKDMARDYGTLAASARGLEARVEIAAYPRNLAGIELPANARAQIQSIAEVRRLYARATCVVLPQRRQEYPFGSEGGGLTALLEAMAMAKPVVATDRPAIREYARDGETALLVPPEDPTALRAAIERVLGDRALARRLGLAGRARVEADYTTRRFAEGLAPLLRDVVTR